jgi:RNA polymerase primary sigma factor
MGPRELRWREIERSEALLADIEPAREYPYEFVYHRITATQTPQSRRTVKPQMLTGSLLLGDVSALILELSNSLDLKLSDLHEEATPLDDLVAQYNVSTKTVSRWRKRGLAARKVIFPDGRRRLVFLESSLRWFTARHEQMVSASAEFQRLPSDQREEIIKEARQIYLHSTLSAYQVCVRLAHEHGRVVETIRSLLRQYDRSSPAQPVFPASTARLSKEQKAKLFEAFQQRTPVAELAKRFRRSRSSIYRMINEIRSRKLLSQSIEYMYSPVFDLPGFAQQIASEVRLEKASDPTQELQGEQPLPDYLRLLGEVPLLSLEDELRIFRRYNYCKFRADILRRDLGPYQNPTQLVERIETLLSEAIESKNTIIQANLRLVVGIAKRHLGPQAGLFELISDGNIALMRAVEKFDYSRRYRFSTYATWAISRNYARTIPEANYQLTHYITGREEMLDVPADGRGQGELLRPEVLAQKDLLLDIIQGLEPREKHILLARFGLNKRQKSQSLEAIGKSLGLSKERVRQIETRALCRIRQLLLPHKGLDQ